MTRFSKLVSITVCALSLTASFAEDTGGVRPFDLYQPIIDKNIFGPPPADPTVMPDKASDASKAEQKSELELAKEQETLEKAVGVSALVQKPDGTIMVGFSDSSVGKSPVHYYLAVGEEKSGWLVKEADVATKCVTLEKDGIEIERTLGDRTGAATAAAADKSSLRRPGDARSTLLSRRGDNRRMGGPMSRRGRRLAEEQNARLDAQRREEARRKADEAAALRREQEQAEKEAEQAETMQRLQDIRNELNRMREQKADAPANVETDGAM